MLLPNLTKSLIGLAKRPNVLLVFVLLQLSSVCWAQNVEIVVNAHQGKKVAEVEWQPTIDFLQQALPQHKFNLVPIPPNQLSKLKDLVARNKVDFVITQPAIYVDLELHYGVSRILTMVKKGGYAEFGSTIITRANSGIQSIADLSGKRLSGVAKLGFGGWLIGYKEMLDNGFDPYKDAKSVEYLGSQTKEVMAVLEQTVDAAVIRTGILEKLAEQEVIDINDFRILSPKLYSDFPLKVSTPLYPEWAFAKTKNVSNTLSKSVALALLSLKSGSVEASSARFQEWTFPYDYQPVHNLLKELRVGPYEDRGKVGLIDFIRQHKVAFSVISILAFLIFSLMYALARSNMRMAKAKKEIAESELRYHEIFSNNQATALLLNPVDGQVLECNKAAVKFYGYDEATLTSMKVSDINTTPVDELNALMQKIKNKEIDYIQTKHRLATGEIRDVEIYPSVIKSGDKILSYAIIFDITEKINAEQALRRAQKMDAVGQLTGGIAHDFNNILGIILGNIELLTKHQLSSEQEKKVYAINKAANRGASLTRKLLAFTRDELTEASQTDINQLITEMENLITRSITPEVEVELKLSAALGQTRINTGDFEDSLLNLVINARDAMKGKGFLTIETGNKMLDESYCKLNPTVQPGQYIEIVVSDNGEGMSERKIEHIYEPFYTTKEPGKGTGLGLAMVYAFVKRSNGHIKVYSEEGIGTSFRLYLPRLDVEEQRHEVNRDFDTPLPHGNETILLVDDEEDLLVIAQDILQPLGYKVFTAQDSMQALDQLENNPDIALMFSDVVMPAGMNGYVLAEQATIKYPKLKVLLTSGFTYKAIARNGQAQFDANLLSKPYNLRDMVTSIQKLLND